jgi:hypothetical protein
MLRFLLLALTLVACAPNPPDPLTNSGSSPLRPGAISGETALLSLVLSADGKAQFDEVRRRPFPFTLRPSEERHTVGATDYLVEVRHESHATVEIPVHLGRSTDAVAEARSPWAGGGTILRAPCYGPKTRYALKRAGAAGERALTEIEVLE